MSVAWARALHGHATISHGRVATQHTLLSPGACKRQAVALRQSACSQPRAWSRWGNSVVSSGLACAGHTLFVGRVVTRPSDMWLGTTCVRPRNMALVPLEPALCNQLLLRRISDVGLLNIGVRGLVDGVAALGALLGSILPVLVTCTVGNANHFPGVERGADAIKVARGASRDLIYQAGVPLAQNAATYLAQLGVLPKALLFAAGFAVGALMGVFVGVWRVLRGPTALPTASVAPVPDAPSPAPAAEAEPASTTAEGASPARSARLRQAASWLRQKFILPMSALAAEVRSDLGGDDDAACPAGAAPLDALLAQLAPVASAGDAAAVAADEDKPCAVYIENPAYFFAQLPELPTRSQERSDIAKIYAYYAVLGAAVGSMGWLAVGRLRRV